MRISIISPNIRLSDAVRRTAEQRVNLFLRRISHRIDHVYVILADDNGLKGGVDKYCRVKVKVRSMGVVTTDARHSILLASIEKAVRRARRIILRQLKRRVTRSRKRRAYTDISSTLDVSLAN